MNRVRIYLTGVGGQGTLTATTLLARTALDQGIEVVSGEIHGMAQRGGVVESTILLGGFYSPRISFGEADILLGFEPLETLRALPYLKRGGYVFSSEDVMQPVSVSAGVEKYPPLEEIRKSVESVASRAWFMPCRDCGVRAGSAQSGNTALLGAVCASGLLPFGIDALRTAIKKFLPPKLVDVNLAALENGVQILRF